MMLVFISDGFVVIILAAKNSNECEKKSFHPRLSHSASYYAAFTPRQGENFRRTLFYQTVKEVLILEKRE